MSGGVHEEFRLMLEKYKYPPWLLDAFRAEVLREAADAINALPQDYECDPGRGDSADLLRRMADEVTP